MLIHPSSSGFFPSYDQWSTIGSVSGNFPSKLAEASALFSSPSEMSMFDAYQEEFDSKQREARAALTALAGVDPKDNSKKSSSISQVNAALDEMSSIVKQQEIEARGMDREGKRLSLEKIGQNKESITAIRGELNSTVARVDRSGLIGGRSGDDRRRLIDANEKLANQNLAIERATKTVAETEDVAGEIMEGLKQNRETIESIKGKVSSVVVEFRHHNLSYRAIDHRVFGDSGSSRHFDQENDQARVDVGILLKYFGLLLLKLPSIDAKFSEKDIWELHTFPLPFP